MESWRCFVAVPVPAELRERLEHDVEAWSGEANAPDLRWTDPAGWHLTLAFLGSVPVEAVPAIRRSIAEVAGATRPAVLTAGGLGVFPAPRRARVLWYGVADPDGALTRLAGGVRERLLPMVPRLAGEEPFRGHVTLGRARAERGIDLSGWLTSHAAPSGRVPLDRLMLYRSHLGRGPARYEELGAALLGATDWSCGAGWSGGIGPWLTRFAASGNRRSR